MFEDDVDCYVRNFKNRIVVLKQFFQYNGNLQENIFHQLAAKVEA
jgi:hypothetical protein